MGRFYSLSNTNLKQVELVELIAGQKFYVVHEIETVCSISYHAPFTGGCEVRLPVGFEFEIMHSPVPDATGVACRALEYERWERALVPADVRAAVDYGGFHLVLLFDTISVDCKLISDAT